MPHLSLLDCKCHVHEVQVANLVLLPFWNLTGYGDRTKTSGTLYVYINVTDIPLVLALNG